MRTILIVALAAGTALPAQAQFVGRGGQTQVQGGQMQMQGGGAWRGGQGQMQTGGAWRGGQSQVQTGGQWQLQGAGQWQRQGGGAITGNDPRTWSPTGGRQFGGDPRTWSPTGRPIGGDPSTWGPPLDHRQGQWQRPGGQWQQQGGQWQRQGQRNGGQWNGGGRWGGYLDGRWYAGGQAPGGWNAYRRPSRGWRMPGYWVSPNWAVNDWQFYGLQAPPAGYGWSRYYDDAVLIDGNGYVYDSVADVDWRRADQPYASGYGYPSQGYWNGPDGQLDPGCYPRRKGSGVAGALVGGAIGAGIGVATGGLGTALIAGGVGALAGQQVDRESRGRQIVCDDAAYYGGGSPGYAYADDGGYAYAQGGQGGVAYAPVQPAYGYAPGVTATATFDFGAPVTTTTTTTTVTEEWVTERRAVRRAVRPRTKVVCRC